MKKKYKCSHTAVCIPGCMHCVPHECDEAEEEVYCDTIGLYVICKEVTEE